MSKGLIFFAIIIVIGIIIRFVQVSENDSLVNFSQETDSFLGYVLAQGEKKYFVRCDKSLWDRIAHHEEFAKQVRISAPLHSSKDDLPTPKENNELFKVEDIIVKSAIDNEKDVFFGGVITGGGKKEYFLYTNDAKKGESLRDSMKKSFPSYAFTLQTRSDPQWTYYQAYCRDRKFPQN